MIFNQSPCTFVKNEKMVHYDKVSIDLVKLKNFKRPADWNSYTEVLFSEDWITRKDLDWNAYLITLLDHVQDLKKHYLPIIDLEFEESDDFFDQCSKFPKEVTLKYNLKESYIAQSAEEETKLEEWDFSRHHLILIENLEMDIQKCFKFFESNKNLPPYSEKVMSINKIPFWGDQMQMTLFLHLLFESDFIPVRRKGVRKFNATISNEMKKQFDTHTSLTKKYAIELACSYFKGVNLEKNQINESVFKPATINSKMNDTLLSEISSENFIEFEERLLSILEHFKSIKNSKELPSNFKMRST